MKSIQVPEIPRILYEIAQGIEVIRRDITAVKGSVGLGTTPLNVANFTGGKSATLSWAQVAAQAKGAIQKWCKSSEICAPFGPRHILRIKLCFLKIGCQDFITLSRRKVAQNLWLDCVISQKHGLKPIEVFRLRGSLLQL
jgi:hypothetical protein